jgi:hypothetical protein
MKRSSKIALFVALLLVSVGIFWIAGTIGPRKTPDELIQESLADAETAAKHRNPAGTMEVISAKFQSGMWNKDRLRLVLARSMQQGRGVDYDVRVNAPRIFPSPTGNPDERIVISRLSAFYTGTGEDIWGSGPLTLVMRKEAQRKWLFFSEPRWRIVSVANVPPLPGDADASGLYWTRPR